jgi:hypothetical protein
MLAEWKEASSSKPRRVDERRGVDDERIAFPFPDAVPVVRCDDRRLSVARASVRGDVPEFRVTATVVGVLAIEHEEVFIGLDHPEGRALSWESQRLARHHWIVLVRPLIEFLNLVPELGFVNGAT